MARTKGPKKIKRYPDKLKLKAVQLADHPDILAKEVAEDLGVHPERSQNCFKSSNYNGRSMT